MILNATNKAKTMHARRNPNNLTVSSAAYSQLSPSVRSASFLSPRLAAQRGLLSPSPPASPSLPSLIPRHGKKPTATAHTRHVKRLLIALVGVTFLVWLVVRQLYSYHSTVGNTSGDGEEYEIVGDYDLPEDPSALIVTDKRGHNKWTVSIPANYDFPLRPALYREICSQSMELSNKLRADVANSGFAKRMLNYYQRDQYYMDIQDAEEQGLLPPAPKSSRPAGFVDDASMVDNKKATEGMKVCDRSLTFVMETQDAGFGNTLLQMWMSYGLAVKENRTFFIDDTRWPYGKFSTYFQPPPAVSCLPPPKSQIVPCPHTARHIIISSALTRNTFGHAFTEEYEDPTKMEVQRQRNIFGLLRTGYEALFHLRADDDKYVTERLTSLYGSIKEHGGISLGMHVRRGDKHPFEFQFQNDYIPLNRYVDTARDIFLDTMGDETLSRKRINNKDSQNLATKHTPSKLILSSDDPTVYDSPEMGATLRAQDRIVLATHTALESLHGKPNPWIDEITGWEGGFYRDVFWSLGQPSSNNANDVASNKIHNENVGEDVLKLRELVGRAYMLDLAVLGKADYVVCTVSSIGCRVLAVMMGWERGIQQGGWRNVDGEFGWKGIMW